jgi:Fe2+ or Zn2+ uptake regulation protein
VTNTERFREMLSAFMAKKGLRATKQRDHIVEAFFQKWVKPADTVVVATQAQRHRVPHLGSRVGCRRRRNQRPFGA